MFRVYVWHSWHLFGIEICLFLTQPRWKCLCSLQSSYIWCFYYFTSLNSLTWYCTYNSYNSESSLLFVHVDPQPHYLRMDLRKCCCPRCHTPTLCSSALVVSPAEVWGTYQWASSDHHCTGARRSPLLPDSGRAWHRKVEISVPPPASCHSSHSPAHSDLITAKGGWLGDDGMFCRWKRFGLLH